MWFGSLYIDLQQVLTSVQILFYLVTGTVIVLTYVNARKSLLNPVHTEYQKHVINRLKELSEELYGEFNPESPNYWLKRQPDKETVDNLNKYFRLIQKHDMDLVEWVEIPAWQMSQIYERSLSLMESVKADPFIPSDIRERVIEFLEDRTDEHYKIEAEAQQYYKRVLVRSEDLEVSGDWVSNYIEHSLHECGFGTVEVEEKVNHLRLEIQRYLESFSPHR